MVGQQLRLRGAGFLSAVSEFTIFVIPDLNRKGAINNSKVNHNIDKFEIGLNYRWASLV